MTIVAARSRLVDLFALQRRSSAEQQNTAARPPTLRGDRLFIALCVGAIAIGIIALIGYVLGNASTTSLNANGKPVPVVTALALILLGAGLLALRSPASSGVLAARRAALAVVALSAADLLSLAFSRPLDVWQTWAARGGVNVHAYPFGALLLIASASALVFITTRKDFAGHVIASAVLLICAVFSFAYAPSAPSFLDPSRVLPVAAATLGIGLISVAELLTWPRGWVVSLLSRTPTGVMSRVLLLAVFIVPVLADALRDLIAGMRWFTPEVDLAVVVDIVEVFLSAAVVLSAGALVYRHERDRLRLASIVDSSSDAIIGKSSEGLIESWNAGAERLYGYTAAEVIGRSVAMLAPPELPDEVLLLERVRRGERVDPFETVRVAKDGRRIDVSLSLSAVLDPEGNVTGASSIARDITQRKQEQEALRRSEELLQAAQRAGGIGHFCWDIQDNINTWSDELMALYGLPPGSFGGQYESWSKRIFPDDLPAADAQIRNSLTSGEFSSDFRVVWPDASTHWMHASAKVFFSDDGKPLRMVGVNVDVTERKQAEEAAHLARERLQTLSRRLLQVQETERRKAARELHDEIGQALTAIKITLQSLQRYPEPAAIADRLDESVGIVERALGQVRSLSLRLRPPLLDDLGLGPALRWLVDQHAGRAGLGVDFRSSVVDARFDTAVETACFRVAQEALNNVVRHAGARYVTVELHLHDDGLHLRVSDDGAGFDVPDAHRRAAQGASLGLLGMEERATLAGGGIEWRSAPGEGAVVHAWFPLSPPAGTNETTAAA